MSADLRVSVVIPALNEQATVADVVTACCASGADEVLVIDSDSSDATAHVAARAGAKVMNWRDVDAREPWPGKGEALWRGVKAASGEVVVFIDADVTNVAPQWVDLSPRHSQTRRYTWSRPLIHARWGQTDAVAAVLPS